MSVFILLRHGGSEQLDGFAVLADKPDRDLVEPPGPAETGQVLLTDALRGGLGGNVLGRPAEHFVAAEAGAPHPFVADVDETAVAVQQRGQNWQGTE